MAAIIDYENSEIISAGLQGQATSDEALHVARGQASLRGESVILYDEDNGSTEYDHYLIVAPDGTCRALSDAEAVNLGILTDSDFGILTDSDYCGQCGRSGSGDSLGCTPGCTSEYE